MNLHPMLQPNSRVTVIDDDEDGCEEIMDILRDFDLEPSAITGSFDDRVYDMVHAIEAQGPSFVICDNRLSARQMAQFNGVAVVKELVSRNHPAMLLTTYGSPDRLVLRKSRYDVPVIVHRDTFEPKRLGDYFDVCWREINRNPVDERRPHRSLIRIDSIGEKPMLQIDAVVPAWRPDHAVPIPIECIAESLRDKISAGTYLLGDVNIGAKEEDELFFHNVNVIAPPPKEGIE
jgi:CheY-like chemotaxis protein